MNGVQWKPNDNRDACQKELECVTNVLKCDAVTGRAATKAKFLDVVSTAAVIHIGNWQRPASCYIVTADFYFYFLCNYVHALEVIFLEGSSVSA